MPKPDIDELRDYMQRAAIARCPSCGGRKWRMAKEPSLVPIVTADGATWNGKGYPALVLTCDTCAYIRFHSMDTLRRLVAAEKKRKGENGAAG